MSEEQSVATSSKRATETSRSLPRIREGVVVSDKMEKSIVVAVTRLIKHRAYKKYVKQTRRFMVHDEENQCEVGDRVRIVHTRPLSSRKRWRVQEIVSKVVKV